MAGGVTLVQALGWVPDVSVAGALGSPVRTTDLHVGSSGNFPPLL